MKITDDVIQKFWGEGRGFVVAGLTRWGGFVKDEDLLDEVYYLSLKMAISARDRNKEFETELHMVNYMMRLCYWSWCKASEHQMKHQSLIINESQLIPKDADEGFKPRLLEPSEDQPDLNNKSTYLIEFGAKLIREKFGDDAESVYRLCILGDSTIKEASDKLGCKIYRVNALLRVIGIYLRNRFTTHAREYGLV